MKYLLFSLVLALFVGCQPQIPSAPVVVVADHIVVVPAGQAYTADRLGYWISAEALDKLLAKLNEQQRQIDELRRATPQTRANPDNSDRAWLDRLTFGIMKW